MTETQGSRGVWGVLMLVMFLFGGTVGYIARDVRADEQSIGKLADRVPASWRLEAGLEYLIHRKHSLHSVGDITARQCRTCYVRNIHIQS